jgi:hypothetical protein
MKKREDGLGFAPQPEYKKGGNKFNGNKQKIGVCSMFRI